MNERYEGHKLASQKGGHGQTQVERKCPRCGRSGRGNNWYGGHILKGKGCHAK